MRSRLVPAASAVAIALAGTVASAAASPDKPPRKTYTVTAVPAPLVVSVRGRGCLDGVEGVNRVSRLFIAPSRGRLTATVRNFTGDWDLYGLDEAGEVVAVANHGLSQLALSEPDTFRYAMWPRERLWIVACNFLGSPTAQVHYSFKSFEREATR